MRFTQKHADHAARLIEEYREKGRMAALLATPGEVKAFRTYGASHFVPEVDYLGPFASLLRQAHWDGYTEVAFGRQEEMKRAARDVVFAHEMSHHAVTVDIPPEAEAAATPNIIFEPEFIDQGTKRKRGAK